MATGNLGRRGVGVNPLRGQNNVQGSCDMGSFPHEFPGYRHVTDDAVRHSFEEAWGAKLDNEPGLRIPNMFDAAVEGVFKGITCKARIFFSLIGYKPRVGRSRRVGMPCRAGPLPQRDGKLRACVSAGRKLP